jgi:hypothetical protein
VINSVRKQESNEVPIRIHVIEQIFHELWTTGSIIIAEIGRLAVRIQELVQGEGRQRRRKFRRARRATKGRKSKAR